MPTTSPQLDEQTEKALSDWLTVDSGFVFGIPSIRQGKRLRKIIAESNLRAVEKAINTAWYEAAKMIVKADKENRLSEIIKIAKETLNEALSPERSHD